VQVQEDSLANAQFNRSLFPKFLIPKGEKMFSEKSSWAPQAPEVSRSLTDDREVKQAWLETVPRADFYSWKLFTPFTVTVWVNESDHYTTGFNSFDDAWTFFKNASAEMPDKKCKHCGTHHLKYLPHGIFCPYCPTRGSQAD